jgi:hypothetical protein
MGGQTDGQTANVTTIPLSPILGWGVKSDKLYNFNCGRGGFRGQRPSRVCFCYLRNYTCVVLYLSYATEILLKRTNFANFKTSPSLQVYWCTLATEQMLMRTLHTYGQAATLSSATKQYTAAHDVLHRAPWRNGIAASRQLLVWRYVIPTESYTCNISLHSLTVMTDGRTATFFGCIH